MTEEELKEIEGRLNDSVMLYGVHDHPTFLGPEVVRPEVFASEVTGDPESVTFTAQDARRLIAEVRRLQMRNRLLTACTTSQPIVRTLDNWWRKR